ncbi:hypothetical protein ABIE89_007406 [Bradyrhizobium niftali]
MTFQLPCQLLSDTSNRGANPYANRHSNPYQPLSNRVLPTPPHPPARWKRSNDRCAGAARYVETTRRPAPSGARQGERACTQGARRPDGRSPSTGDDGAHPRPHRAHRQQRDRIRARERARALVGWLGVRSWRRWPNGAPPAPLASAASPLLRRSLAAVHRAPDVSTPWSANPRQRARQLDRARECRPFSVSIFHRPAAMRARRAR